MPVLLLRFTFLDNPGVYYLGKTWNFLPGIPFLGTYFFENRGFLRNFIGTRENFWNLYLNVASENVVSWIIFFLDNPKCRKSVSNKYGLHIRIYSRTFSCVSRFLHKKRTEGWKDNGGRSAKDDTGRQKKVTRW